MLDPHLDSQLDSCGGADREDRQRAQALRIELASLRAWPAHVDIDFDGWRLRFANGYTRRANSITPLGPSQLSIEDKIAACERLYAERGLPAIFRLTPFAPPELDEMLGRRGYRPGAESEVRARPLGPTVELPARSAKGTLRTHPVDRWLDLFSRMSGAAEANRTAHRAVLQGVPGARRLQALWAGGAAVACGMSVQTDGLLGMFDLVTAPEQRNRGYGSELLRRALQAGTRAGATLGYLQVLERNTQARRIYERAGFEVVYRYHYREPP